MNATAVAENIIDRDREYDQTARTETPGPRTVSPAILEHRIQMLQAELRQVTIEKEDYKRWLGAAEKKIAGFERLSSTLAAVIDVFGSYCKTFAEGAVVMPTPICGTPGHFGNCILLNGHEGPCRSESFFLTSEHL